MRATQFNLPIHYDCQKVTIRKSSGRVLVITKQEVRTDIIVGYYFSIAYTKIILNHVMVTIMSVSTSEIVID